jgi:sugar phosphate isomerase/epimerase
LKQLRLEQIIDVHVNDCPAKPADEQHDQVRALPGETGTIDIKTFLGTLKAMGYEGPVMVEPFSQRVREMTPDDACAATATSLKKVLNLA